MKALTISQPWASLIMAGVKTIETRPAPPNGPMRPDGVRGLPGLAVERGERIAIHAAAQPAGYNAVAAWRAVGPPSVSLATRHEGYMAGDPLPLGAVLGTVEVVDALPVVGDHPGYSPRIADLPHEGELAHQQGGLWIIGVNNLTRGTPTRVEDQRPLGDFTPGRWGWLLADPQPLPDPVPCKGRQGVWEFDEANRPQGQETRP